jgi:ureidoglycolate lyase
MRTLIAEPLTSASFAPFGDVVDAASATATLAINQGRAILYRDLANIDIQDGETCVSFVRSTPMAPPIVIRRMERHPLGSQAFMPLGGRPFLVVAAPPGPLATANIRAFLTKGDQGVNYARGAWHHFLLALDEVTDFLVIDRKGEGANLDEAVLPENEQVLVRIR